MLRFDRNVAAALALMGLTVGATTTEAREVASGPATYSVVVRHADLHPRSPKAAQVSLGRIGDAAAEACGASSFSLREVKASIKASTCWRDSMADVLARIGDPMLSDAYERVQRHQHG